MNITMESLQAEIAQFQRIIDKYMGDPEYVNPKYSLAKAMLMIDMLERELHFNTKR